MEISQERTELKWNRKHFSSFFKGFKKLPQTQECAIKILVAKPSDILVWTETKIHSSFPNVQFRIEVFSMPFRIDRNRLGRGVLIYVKRRHILLNKHNLPDDIEGFFVGISLRKVEWLLFGAYRPPWQEAEYFLKHVNYALHWKSERFLRKPKRVLLHHLQKHYLRNFSVVTWGFSFVKP